MTGVADIVFSPFVPWWALAALGAVALLLVGFGLWRRFSGLGWRIIAIVALLAALANPAIVEEERDPQNDVAIVVVDDSASQGIGERRAQTDGTLERLRGDLERQRNLETRVVRAGAADASSNDGTRLFDALSRALSDVPPDQLAGVVFLTDGQIHDVPERAAQLGLKAPLHVLLAGSPDEGDRRLVIERAPSYGIVENGLEMTVRVIDEGAAAPAANQPAVRARVTLRIDGGETFTHQVPVGRSTSIPFRLNHGGLSVVEIEAEAGPRELTLQNNRAAIGVNGVRDRLRVLLVSGQPHQGERVWRSLLKADPSVDLVHFTILRPPEKQDGTSVRELSLIAFPTRELFEVKLDEFDLIIFDNYKQRGILLPSYVENIAKYVQNGGALLEAAGTDFATPRSLFRSPLGRVLPAEPTGTVQEQGFKPRLTDDGRRHPVTADLTGAGAPGGEPTWGRWFRQIDTDRIDGVSLMSGINERPLLVLNRSGQGRVAQLLSDQGWLWARGYEGGGPQAELLRRIAHWLMKEPDLEEEDLRAIAQGNRIEIMRRSLKPNGPPVTITTPSGATESVPLGETGGGRQTAVFLADAPGLYRLTDGQHVRVAAVGAVNPKEFADVRATPELVRPLVGATGGKLAWIADGIPEIRRVTAGRGTEGRDWMGLLANESYVVTGVRQTALLPPLLVLLLVVGGLMWAWHREGRR